MPKIIAHCLVRNEERFIWYSINSVLPYVDKIMVWDTGSTDKTLDILQLIKSPKLEFKEIGQVNVATFPKVRQHMLDSTPNDYDWLMILDGDEIWPDRSIKTAVNYCRFHPESKSLVVRTRNLVGDIYHCLPESSGRYHLAGHIGHLNLRFMNLKTIPGLHAAKPHGQQGYFDSNDMLVQDLNPSFLDVYYSHATHLSRSSSTETPKRQQKFKLEFGDKILLKNQPEIFFIPHPNSVPDVTSPAPFSFWLKAALLTLPRRFKRLVFPPAHGY